MPTWISVSGRLVAVDRESGGALQILIFCLHVNMDDQMKLDHANDFAEENYFKKLWNDTFF